MKKITLLLVVCLIVIGLSACTSSGGDIKNVKENIGESTKFTQEEIQQAIDITKEKFKTFENCKLNSLEYDEEKSNTQIEYYLSGGKGSENGATAENTIILFSEFYVNDKAGGAWTPDSDYTWMFTLIRESKDADWVVDDCGY